MILGRPDVLTTWQPPRSPCKPLGLSAPQRPLVAAGSSASETKAHAVRRPVIHAHKTVAMDVYTCNCILAGRQESFRSGVAAQAAVQYSVSLRGPLYCFAEAKVTGAWARVPVADGTADVPALAIHGLLGVGYRW